MVSSLTISRSTCKVVNLLDSVQQRRGELTPEQWDAYVDQHPKGSIFHTAPMIRATHAAKAHEVLPLAAVDNSGAIVAMLVAVRVQTLPDPLGRISSRSILYAEPLCNDDPQSKEALQLLVDAHDRYMDGRVLFSEVRALDAPAAEREALEQNGFELKDYLNYVIDLNQPLETLWSNLTKSARRGVRQCEKHGFHIRELNSLADVHRLYEFLKSTYRRAQVPLADVSLFESVFAELQPRGMIQLIATYEGDTPLAIDSLINYKGRSFAWYGGLERVTGVSPFDYLQWYEIVWAKEHGYQIYDFGGAGYPDEPYGVRDYKAKFGGELVSFGRYRKVYSPWKMRLAQQAYQLGRVIISPK
jgi:serine/alanine adding enzyme